MADPQPGSQVTRRRTVELFGLPIDALTMDETVSVARAMVRSGTPHQHVVVNASKLVQTDRDPLLRDVVRNCDLVSADGMSAVWASRWLGSPLPARVTGVDLFARLVQAAHEDGSSVYFLGATEEVVTKVAGLFAARYPGLRVAGFRNGYWNDDEEVVASVRAANPEYLFLAIPSPRKEFWLEAHLAGLNVPFVMGVGGSFDVIAGKVGRAPLWVQRAGFEWAWRLGQEPRRMWRRYLVGNAAFIRLTLREWKRVRAAPLRTMAADAESDQVEDSGVGRPQTAVRDLRQRQPFSERRQPGHTRPARQPERRKNPGPPYPVDATA